MLPVLLGLLGGAGLPVQTSANARLRASLVSPFASSLVSFAIGTVALAAVVLVLGAPVVPTAAARAEPPWLWVGGVFGVVFLTLNILLLPRLGAVQTAIFPIVGQVIMGLVIDALGLFRAPQADLTAARLLGAVFVVAGAVGVTLAGRLPLQRAAGGRAQGASAWLWRLAAVGGGVLSAAQTAVNGRLGQVLGGPLGAALISFGVGTALLLVLNLALRTHRQRPRGDDGRPLPVRGPWWMWIGGLLGAVFVSVNAALAPVLGTGLTVVVVLLGNLVASTVVDRVGALGNPARPVTARHLLSLAVLVVGVVVVRLLG